MPAACSVCVVQWFIMHTLGRQRANDMAALGLVLLLSTTMFNSSISGAKNVVDLLVMICLPALPS
jgi:hypothetical protein